MTPNFKNSAVLGAYTGAGPLPDTHPEELIAAYSRIEELETALRAARIHLVTLGGDEPDGCQVQQAVLSVVNGALS